MSANAHPMRRLIGYARDRQRDVWLASLYSVLNKIFDVLPEILIGVAVDVVVNRHDSFLARLGLPDPVHQLLALTALTIVVWVLESVTEYLAAVRWRNLAQHLQHRLRIEGYGHLQRLDPGRIEQQRSGRLMAVLNEDVNQIERFLNTGAHDLLQVACSSLLVGAVFVVLTPGVAVLAMLPALWLMAVWVGDKWAGLAGLVWVAGRVLYVTSYIADPEKRGPGFMLTFLPFAAAWITSLAAISMTFLR